MALVDLDSWATEYESCNRLNKKIFKELHQRENSLQLSKEFNQLSSQIEVALKQYNNELKQLALALNETVKQGVISFEEIDNRRGQLHLLQKQFEQLQEIYNTKNGHKIIDIGLNEPQSSNKNIEVLQVHQKTMIEEQNQNLEELSQTISRQKSLAARMGQEIEDQNEVLDNLANTMERVESGVHHGTRNIGLLNRYDNSTWRYWLIIISLFIAIIIVTLL